MSDVGTAGFSREEQDGLRSYLLSGGFLYVDDFWGDRAISNWKYEIQQIFPPDEYPLRDLNESHPVFREPFDVGYPPQIPSSSFWNASEGNVTSERGAETAEHRYLGIFDKDGRLMILMSFNTDIGDGWEFAIKRAESEREKQYQDEFSDVAIKFGVNVVTYALKH